MQYKTEVGKSFGYNTQIKDLTIVTKPSYYYLTSTIYPLEFLDGLSTSVLNTDGRSSHKDDLGVQRFNQDTTSTSFTDISGTLKVALKVYEYSRTEEDIDKVQGSVSSVTGVLRLLLFSSTMKVENTLTSFTGISGVLRSALIAYNFYKQESTLSLITALEAIYINVQTSFESYVKGTSTVYSYPVVMNNVMFTSTIQTMSFNASTLSTTNTSGYTLVFRDPLTEVDAKNVVLIFGREQSNLPKDPEVIINEYTTSALDFENDLIDKVSTTVWNKEGTGNVTSVNKIFGNNSFETKTLGDSLSTTSNIITGGATPFTIEFYALIKALEDTSVSSYINIVTGDHIDFTTNGQGLYIHRDNKTLVYYRYMPDNLDVHSKLKISFNEINKITMSYDGACIRIFINDYLSNIIGTLSGFIKRDFIAFYKSISNTSKGQILGLIDNINIFDGEARVVRDYDEHADKLVVDLAFDGENNSTKIVDNGTLKNNWTVNGNAKISTDQKFDGFSSLHLDGSSMLSLNDNNIFNFAQSDFTINFDMLPTDNSQYNIILSSDQPTVNGNLTFIAIGSNTDNTGRANKLYIFEYLYNKGSYTIKTFKDIPFNIVTNIKIIKKNSILYIFINNILDSQIVHNRNFNLTYNISTLLGGSSFESGNKFKGYIKNFKVYKDVAIIPEDPTGKIQLDFDNNLVDKYGNSTWTNNGVTFDQVNSVKGYSAYFDNITTDYLETSSESLNFNKGNFKIDFSFKNLNSSGELFSNNISPNSVGSIWYPINPPNSAFGYLDFYGKPSNTTYNDRVIIGNAWYDNSIVKKNNILIEYRNDVIAYVMNGVSDKAFNLIGGGSCRIGKPTSTFGLYNGFGGYLDNFKSYKEGFVNLNSSIYLTGTNGGDVSFNVNGDVLNTVWASGTTTFPVKRYVHVFDDCPSIVNYKIEVEVYISSTNNKIFRLHTNTNNYQLVTEDYLGYSLYIYDNIVELSKGGNNNSSWVDIAEARLPTELRNDEYHLFKIIKNYNNFQLYVDDILYININDSRWANISSKPAFGGNNYNATSLRTTSIKSIRLFDLNDNELYYRDWKSKIDNVIDRPAVHLPLETNAINTGFTPLTINSVGSPTYTTIDGKKCIKFESGKYLTIDANNIFNLGTSSDFYLEMDVYVDQEVSLRSLITNSSETNGVYIVDGRCYLLFNNSYSVISDNICSLNKWTKIIIKRTGSDVYLDYDGVLKLMSSSNAFDLGVNTRLSYNTNGVVQYITNFKMFVGTSEIPETYNDKTVLDLDFKPTRKSYLFKDNNNKCVIHPVNITQRDYQDSQYCCSFNGTNQYLQLGKNELLNFGNDDFIIAIKFKVVSSSNTWNTILSGASTYTYIDIQSNGTLHVCLGQNSTSTVGTIPFNTIVTLIISVKNNILSVYVNNVKVPMSLTSTSVVNFNESNNTFIGAYGALSTYFNGSIYSIKVLRNTTDLTLLESEEESGGGEDNYTPITLSLNTPSTVENPVEGSYTNIYGVIRYADLLPTVTVMFNGNEVNQSDITLTSRGTINAIEQDYDLQIRILNDALDGTYPVTVTVDDTSDVANGSTNLTVIRDYPLLTQGIDSFNTSWYQLSSTNKVGMRNYQEELMMYFNGLSSLTANGYSWKFGLDQFTIELDFALTKSPTTNNYHILSCGKTESWYAIEITSNIEIRFLNRGTVKVSTTTNAINVDTKYRLAISRDSNYNLRIFLNGIKVAEAVDNSNYTFDEDTSDLNHNVFLGRDGTLYTDTVAEKHFKGYMKNFYFNKGVCLYTENYTPTVLDKGITTKSLLTFTSDDVGFTTKVDSFNPNITWTNSGCTVVNNQLVLGSVSNRLVSTENDLFNFTNQNWTIDIIGTTSQITTEAVLFDNRLSGSSFNGILIRQSPSDPTSLTISLGISTATTGYSYIINTGVNSLVANTEFNLKVVRSLGQLAIFFNGVRKNRTTIYTNSFETSKTVCIGNNKDFNKGFNGKIKQVRIINGIATDVHAYPVIEGDILT